MTCKKWPAIYLKGELMNLISHFKPGKAARYGLMILALALTGCHRDQVTVQDVPKESDATMPQPAEAAGTEQMPANPHAGMDMAGGGAALPQVKWTLPAGWQEKPLSEMRVGSFDAKGADVSIIPLPSGGPQMELGIYNMWRGELQLPTTDKVESTPVTVGSEQGKLYEVSGGKVPGRILVAALDKNGMSWYFKMRGDEKAVEDQRPAFLEFLKSVSFEAAPTTAITDPHASVQNASMGNASMGLDTGSGQSMANAGVPLPAGWKQVPAPSAFLLAKYDIEGSGGAKAEVNVSALGGTGGGVIMNVNRWRGQLGLGQVSEEDFSKQAQTLDVGGTKATVVDLTGTDSKTGQKSRLIGVIVPQADQTWFYKLMGDGQVVEQQKDAFTKFVQTAKFGN